MSGYGRTVLSAPPCVSFQAMKNGRPRPTHSPCLAIYASADEAAQPPDDRTYSAEVTGFRRNLPHHRSALLCFPEKSADSPYTRLIMIPPFIPFVKHKFGNNHKNLYKTLWFSQADLGNIFLYFAFQMERHYTSPPISRNLNISRMAFSRSILFSFGTVA